MSSTQMRYPERKMARENHAWSGTAVRALLNNRFYLGEMAYGKSVRKSVGSKEGIAVPKNEWKVITDHHEPLVTPEVFVLTELYRELMRRGDLIKQHESLEQFQKDELRRLGRDMENSRMQYRNLQKEADALYESYALKQTEATDYRSRADGIALRMQELTCKIEKAEQELARLTEEYHRPKQDMKDIIRFAEMKELTQEMVDVFIKKVTVYKGKRVEIEWNYALGEE